MKRILGYGLPPEERKEFGWDADDFPTPALPGSGPGVETSCLLSANFMRLPQRFLSYCYHSTDILSIMIAPSIKEWILFIYFFSDRIYRINWIFSRFPKETVKIASAYQRRFANLKNKIEAAMIYLLMVDRISTLILAYIFSAKRIAYTRFHPRPPCLSGTRWRAGGNRIYKISCLSCKSCLK
jgi:hypothetical protein